jgi:penicillin amidase
VILLALRKHFLMRIVRALFLPVITILLLFYLDRPHGALPALGRLLDPVNGWASAAEGTGKNFSQNSAIKGMHGAVSVWFESRLVPHIHASDDHDLYFMQGYLHACFRLWQMDMQTRAAAGRVSEVVGEKAMVFDRTQRRKGMVFAAEHSLQAMEADPRSKQLLDAYTEGVNAWISSLSYRSYPLEYKLMGFTPEPWTNIKCALLLKYMADDLTGYTEDIPLTILRDILSPEQFAYLFPQRIKGSNPVIPEGSQFATPSMDIPQAPSADSAWAHLTSHLTTGNRKQTNDALAGSFGSTEAEEASGIGSNNWAISGQHTSSGAAILCNDPHLGLNLPSLWYEIQLQCPGLNVYGVSLPGAPGIVIGFNDSISWGVTNNYRDVKDFYDIEAVDNNFYLFDGAQRQFDKRVERIKIKGAADLVDTVLYTVHGPVMYDEQFPDPAKTGRKLAMCWMAHRGTNELLSLYLLNRASDYTWFIEAAQYFECPAQNFAYADRAGNIAMWAQGQFINKWKDQGRYVMKGNTSATLWATDIPMAENPHVINPEQGFVASANQVTTDSTYPYWYNGYFYDFRAWRINGILNKMTRGVPSDDVVDALFFSNDAEGMKHMQNDLYSILIRAIDPILKSGVSEAERLGLGKRTPGGQVQPEYMLYPFSRSAPLFQIWWGQLYADIWKDDFSYVPNNLWPSQERTMQLLLTDSTLSYYDDVTTRQKETLTDLIKRSYKETLDSLDRLENAAGSEWYQVKNTTLNHLTKLPAFSYAGLKIGGWGNVINAVKQNHGPSWRMIVEMDKEAIHAYGVYPGGQSGNPGSKYYGTFVNKWVAGKYNDLIFLANRPRQDSKAITYTWNIKPE